MLMTRNDLAVFATNAAPLYETLVSALGIFEINTAQREAAFLAQAAHETGGFQRFTENLNYSAQGLINTWPTRFTPQLAAALARQPERIANHVYANRLGNGPPESGMGWRFRGRGIFQLTGFDNYLDASLALYGTDELVQDPDRVAEARDACLTAGRFWAANHLAPWADVNTYAGFEKLTRKINGGAHGFDDHDPSDLDTRVDWWNRARRLLHLPEIRS